MRTQRRGPDKVPYKVPDKVPDKVPYKVPYKVPFKVPFCREPQWRVSSVDFLRCNERHRIGCRRGPVPGIYTYTDMYIYTCKQSAD